MTNQDEFFAVIKSLIRFNIDAFQSIIKSELVDTGRISITNIERMVSLNKNEFFETFTEDFLCIIYKTLYDTLKGKTEDFPIQISRQLKAPSYFFTESQIREAAFFSENKNTEKGVKLPILVELVEGREYLSYVSVKTLEEIRRKGLIHLERNMQRESVAVKIGNDNFVYHINYDDKRAREIGNKIAKNQFHPNALRWHIIDGACDYSIKDNEFILKDGFFCEIDGQHRDRGCEYALIENPAVEMNIPIIITTGNISYGQDIINQEEKRAPINRHFINSIENTSAKELFKLIKSNEDLDSTYRFVNSTQQKESGSGWIFEDVFINSLKEFFDTDNMSRKKMNEVANWIVGFLNDISDVYFNEFKNYSSCRHWAVSTYSIKIFICLASYFYGKDDYIEELEEILRRLDGLKTVAERENEIMSIVKNKKKGVI